MPLSPKTLVVALLAVLVLVLVVVLILVVLVVVLIVLILIVVLVAVLTIIHFLPHIPPLMRLQHRSICSHAPYRFWLQEVVWQIAQKIIHFLLVLWYYFCIAFL